MFELGYGNHVNENFMETNAFLMIGIKYVHNKICMTSRQKLFIDFSMF